MAAPCDLAAYEKVRKLCDWMIKTQRRADALEDEATLSCLEAQGMSHDIFLDVYRHRYTVHVKSTTSIHRSNCACNGARSALGEHVAACRRYSAEEFATLRLSAPPGSTKGGRRSGPWAFEGWRRSPTEPLSKLGLCDTKAADQRCYVRRFLEKGDVSSIVEIAAAVNASSYLLVRMLIEQVCNVKKGARVKALIKDPARIAEECARHGVAPGAAERLRAALRLSAEVDPHYSPHIDRLKVCSYLPLHFKRILLTILTCPPHILTFKNGPQAPRGRRVRVLASGEVTHPRY